LFKHFQNIHVWFVDRDGTSCTAILRIDRDGTCAAETLGPGEMRTELLWQLCNLGRSRHWGRGGLCDNLPTLAVCWKTEATQAGRLPCCSLAIAV